MKKYTHKRVAAISLATIMSLNIMPLAFAESEIRIPENAPLSLEIETLDNQDKSMISNNANIKTEISKLDITGDGNANSIYTIEANATSQNGVLYKYYVKDLNAKSQAWTVIQDYSEKTSATWTPKKGGDYWYGIHVKDKNSKEAKDNHLYIPISIKNVENTILNSLDIEGSIRNNSKHTIRAKGESKNGLLYKFYIKDLKANKWIVVQDYSEKTSATWTPSKSGDYWYGVHIKDKKSKDAKDTHLYIPITIKDLEPAQVESFEIEGSLEVKSPKTLRASAVSPNKALYKFYIKDLSTNKWTIIQDYSEKNTATWVPEKKGDYWYGVHVKDIASLAPVKDNHLYKNVRINPLSPAVLEDLTITGGGYEKTNHTIKANATATNDVLYKFYVKDLSTNKWTIIQDYSKKNTVNWKPQKVGKYWYGVHIKDEKSDNAKDNHLYTPITINPPVYYNVTKYNDTLDQALDKQVGRNTIYKNGKPVKAIREEIKEYMDPSKYLQFKAEADFEPSSSNVGKVGTITTNLNIRSGPATSYDKIGSTSQGQKHKILQESGGWYLIDLPGNNSWISGDYVTFSDNSKGEDKPIFSLESTTATLNVRTEPNTTSVIKGKISPGEIYVVLEQISGWFKINIGGAGRVNHGWVSSDHTKLTNDVPRDMYQFMILSGQCGVSANQMNSELKGKGILEGHGAAFIEGAKKYNVNELYLMAHAFLETGYGTSTLSKGVLVSSVSEKDENGKTYQKPVEPRVVYNMYGINAFDKSALKDGSERAYKEGWFTPKIAIVEGANWISKNYINNAIYKQDTLYKMKYNPVTPGTHQYATDIAWPKKQLRQIDIMMDYYKKMDGALLKFDIPTYR